MALISFGPRSIVLLYLMAVTTFSPSSIVGFMVVPIPSTRSNTDLFPSAPATTVTSSSLQRPPRTTKSSILFLAAAELPEVDTMKAKEMKNELESYGVSTKSLLEKREFLEALRKARADGMEPLKEEEADPKTDVATSTTATSNDNDDDEAAAAANGDGNNSETKTESSAESSREERYQKALDEAKAMKVGDLKKELKDRGISTASFLEKTEFVKAYAGAIADKIPKGASSSSSSSKSKASTKKKAEEPKDPSYRDVVTQKFDKRRLMGQSVIDVSIR